MLFVRIFLAVEVLLWPVSARKGIRDIYPQALKSLILGVGAALAPFQEQKTFSPGFIDTPPDSSNVSPALSSNLPSKNAGTIYASPKSLLTKADPMVSKHLKAPSSDELAINAVNAGRAFVATATVSRKPTYLSVQKQELTHMRIAKHSKGLLASAEDEPTLWAKKFPGVISQIMSKNDHYSSFTFVPLTCAPLNLCQSDHARAVSALRRCFNALSGLHTATDFNHEQLEKPALVALNLFRSQAVTAVEAAAAEWNGWNERQVTGESSKLDAVASGSRVAAPLTLFSSVSTRHLVVLRDSQLLTCFAKAQPTLSNAASSGIMATYVFCEVNQLPPSMSCTHYEKMIFKKSCVFQELSTALAELGRALRDIRSKETPVGEF